MTNGYEGFVLEGATETNTPPRIRWTDRWQVELDIEIMSPAAISAGRVPVV